MSDLSEGLESDNSAQGPVTMLRKSELSNPVKVGMLRPSLFSAQLGGGSGGGVSSTTTTTAASSSSETSGASSASSASGSNSTNNLNKSSTTAAAAAADPTNIFLKVPNDDDDSTDTKKQTPDDKKEDPTNLLKKNCPNVPTLAATTIPLSESSGHFVFGQNIHERVVGENIQKPSSSDSNAGEASGSSTTSSDTGLMFSSASLQKGDGAEATATPKETDSKCLSEVARVYEESRAQKRKYDEVETFTGEENEINIIELNCKIFAFVNGNWEERGRGSLRLNDAKDNSCSRVVFRTSGNLRLLVNTKIWPGMVLQRPSQKSIRITAMDNMNQIKIFLFMARPDDIAVMYNAMLVRVNKCKENDNNSMENDEQQHNGDSTSSNGNNRDDEPDECDEPSPKKAVLVDND